MFRVRRWCRQPPRSGSRRGDSFSLLHELCHHIIDSDDETADLLFAKTDRKRSDQLQDDICDAFAAAVLINDGVWCMVCSTT